MLTSQRNQVDCLELADPTSTLSPNVSLCGGGSPDSLVSAGTNNYCILSTENMPPNKGKYHTIKGA